MNEEDNEEIVDTEPAKNRRPFYIILAVAGIVVAGGFGIWYLRSRDTGQVVQPPSTVTYGDNSNAQTGNTTTEETVTIQADQVEKIGIKIEPVGETLSSEAMTVVSTGVIQPNAYKETPVISQVGGVLTSVNGQLGQNVSAGQSLAVVFSDELAASQSRYLALQTEARTARQNFERTARLVKISPTSNAELDQALAALKTSRAELVEHHKHHARSVKLLEIGAVSREEVEQATTKLITAEAKVVEAKRRYDRAVQVAEINPSSRSEFEAAAVRLQTAESDLTAAKQKLLLLGLSQEQVNSLRSPSQITSEVSLRAPVSGTITKRDVNAGQVIEANKELMQVTNLSNV